MLSLIRVILLDIINWLPQSPFQSTYDGVIYKLDFLPYLNWFIPFDNALMILQLWLPCIITYYLYDGVSKFLKEHIISKIK